MGNGQGLSSQGAIGNNKLSHLQKLFIFETHDQTYESFKTNTCCGNDRQGFKGAGSATRGVGIKTLRTHP